MFKEELISKIEERERIIKALRVKKYKNDILGFAAFYLPHLFENKTPDFHKEIYALLKEKRLGLAAPRGFAKSTIVQIIYGLHCLLYNEKEDILTISNSSDLAQEWIRKIKLELNTNEKILSDFDFLLWGENQSSKWTESHISIEHLVDDRKLIYSQMRAKGRGCQVRGFRPTKILCDDLEDKTLVRSEEQRKQLREWFLSALLRTIKYDQQIVFIGTILHPLSLIADIIQNKDYFSDWKTRKFRALEDSKSIWEDRFPTHYLLEEQRKDSYSFQSEFQNEPIDSTLSLFKQEWLKTYTDLPKITEKFFMIDPAISTRETADFTAFVILGQGDDGNIYELDTKQGRWGTWKFVEEFFAMIQKHGNEMQVGIEEIAFQQVYRKLLIEEANKRKIHLNIKPITLGTFTEKERKLPKDKFSRALSITHLFEQGKVFLKSENLINQLILFPSGDHDDLVDALVYGLKMIVKFSKQTKLFFEKNYKDIIRTPKELLAGYVTPEPDWRLIQ